MESIKGKLTTSFIAIISILVIAGGFFVVANLMVVKKYENIMDNMVSEYNLIGETQSFVDSFNNLIKYIRDQERMDEFISNREALRELVYKLDVSATYDQNSFSVYLGLRNTITGLIKDAENGIEAISSGKYSEVGNYYESVNNKNIYVKENTTVLILKELAYLKDLQIQIIKLRQMIELSALSLFILVAVSSVIYAIRFSNRLIKPLYQLTVMAKTISGGNLDAPLDSGLMKSGDEISSLAGSFSKMVYYLKDNINKLQEYNSEIKTSRNRIRAEKKKLQQYLDEASIFVVTFDFEGRIIMVNRKGQEMLGIGEDDAVGRDWISSYIVKKDRIRTRSLISFITGGVSKVDTLENSLVGADGKEKNIVWHFSVLRDEKGESQSVLGTGVDITELAQAKVAISQLKEVDRLKNEVLNIATHELKTPLISIVGLSEVMKKDPKNIPDDYKEYISIINSEGEKLNRLIKNMLTVSRNELGKISITNENIVVSELADSIKTSLEMLTKRTLSKLVIKNEVGDMAIESDREKISQVLYNFVDNAVKYGPREQSIEVSFSLDGKDKIRMAVKGEGAGIDKELQKKLFLKFSQLEPSLSRSQDGMGLGLYICKQNINALGGDVGVESEPGQGATFYFSLPTGKKIKKEIS